MKFAASAVVLSALVSSAFAQTQTCSRSYTVQDGDWCDKISAAQNVSTYQLAVTNKDIINEACSNLEVGQNLCLGYTGQDCATTYVVEEGDYCDLITSKYGINNTMLYTNNPQIDENCYILYIGEVLCVANSELVTPPPAGFVLPGTGLDDDVVDDSSDDTSSSSSTSSSSDDTTSDPPADDAVTTTKTSAAAAVTTTKTSAAAAATTSVAAVNNSVNDDADNDGDNGDDGDNDECED